MNYWNIVRNVVEEADIVIEIVDARFPQQSRNNDLERLAHAKGKKILIILNKSDLVSRKKLAEAKKGFEYPAIFVSTKDRKGKTRIKKTLGMLSEKKDVKVAICGYPNTGKSSIANMLRGKKSSRTSSTAGFTKGKQAVRLSSKIMLIDTPGIIPLNEHDETLMVMLSAKNPQHLKDIEGTGLEIGKILLENNKEKLLKYYEIEAKDEEELLEQIALKRNKMRKGNIPDTNSAAMLLINDFQKGKIGL
ncbi:MAG TPA: GTPase [archaeon]|nr:GTPase [archaeon]